MQKPKPGWKTSEFWLSLLVVVLGAGVASGKVGDTGTIAKVVALGVSVLGALNYTFVRSSIKRREGSDKPGWRTTEFWLSLAAIVVSMVTASGLAVDGSTLATIVGLAASVLGAMGYTRGRGAVKTPSDVATTIDVDILAKAAGEPYADK